MQPKRGDLAVCSLGFVGVIDCDEPQPVTYPDGNTSTAWTGKVLLPDDRMGAPWSSRNPILIAYVLDDGTYAAEEELSDE